MITFNLSIEYYTKGLLRLKLFFVFTDIFYLIDNNWEQSNRDYKFRKKAHRPTWHWLRSGRAERSASAQKHMEVHFQECSHAL